MARYGRDGAFRDPVLLLKGGLAWHRAVGPQLPALNLAGQDLRQLVTVSVTGAKSQAWLVAHMDNPFRDWVEDSKAFGKAACSAYTRAWHAVDVIAPDTPDRLDAAERALRGLVADLNVINDEHGLIDTIYREQAWDAFCDLAKRLHVPDAQTNSWFDEGRRF